MKGAISQFDLSTLPKVSRAELALHKLMSGFHLDIDALNTDLSAALASIEPSIFTNSPLFLRSFCFVKSELALSWFGADTVTVHGYLGAAETFRFAISLERQSAKALVHQALGGSARGTDATPASESDLTPIEEGIFTFLVSSVIFAIKTRFLDGRGLSVRLAPLESEDAGFLSSSSHALEMAFQLGPVDKKAEVKLLVEAHPNLLSLFQKPNTRDLVLGDASMRASQVRIPFCARIGEISLSAGELASLEVDDVIVLDQTGVKLDSDALSGDMICHIGDPTFETVRGRLSSSLTGNYSCEISKF